MSSSWKSLIFDFDNTLVASSIDFRGLKQEIIALLHQNDLLKGVGYKHAV